MVRHTFILITLAFCCICLADEVIDLKVESGGYLAKRDSRVFQVPVRCAGEVTDWIWACGGWTTVSEDYANRCNLRIVADPETEPYLDADGRKVFLGSAKADVGFGGRAHRVDVKVMRSTDYNKGMTGTIGYDVASVFQWEMNPDPVKPTLTLRPLGTRVPGPVLAKLPLKDENDNLWLNVKIRNVAVDVLLMPQSSDIQVAPDLQKKWDLLSGEKHEIRSIVGNVKTRILEGRDSVEFSPQIKEYHALMILVGDKNHPERTPSARSGLGQSILNRFVYRVDSQAKEFTILRKTKASQPYPSTQPIDPNEYLPKSSAPPKK